MKKKITLALVALVALVAGVAGMAAYEAHVINVTAKIENALSVETELLDFGTVFPQEYLVRDFTISLSDSFQAQDRLDDVKYFIKQKPKPKHVMPEGLPILKPDINMYMDQGVFTALYPHWIDDDSLRATYCHTMSPNDPGDPSDSYYINCYPTLCPYLSKHKHVEDDSMATDQCVGELGDGTWYYDCEVDAFHGPDELAYGYLVQSVNDDADRWVIDLAVPCFEGQCAQDWTHQGWELPAGMESEVFGCDLWIEVYDFSEWTTGT